MNWTVALRILGLLLMMFSLTMLPPVLVSLYYNDQSWLPFLQSFFLTLGAGTLFWFPVRNKRKDLRLRDGFLVSHRSGLCLELPALRRSFLPMYTRCHLPMPCLSRCPGLQRPARRS